MDEKKKKWGKPKLIILTRGKPEERVLGACKILDDLVGSIGNGNQRCYQQSCYACYEISGT